MSEPNPIEELTKIFKTHPFYPRDMPLPQYSGWDKRIENLTSAITKLSEVIEKLPDSPKRQEPNE